MRGPLLRRWRHPAKLADDHGGELLLSRVTQGAAIGLHVHGMWARWSETRTLCVSLINIGTSRDGESRAVIVIKEHTDGSTGQTRARCCEVEKLLMRLLLRWSPALIHSVCVAGQQAHTPCKACWNLMLLVRSWFSDPPSRSTQSG